MQLQIEFSKFHDIFNSSSTAKYHGWSVTGIKRFNELFDLIEKERMTALGNSFDSDLIKYSMEKTTKQKRSKKLAQ